jgi:hypothetical protein
MVKAVWRLVVPALLSVLLAMTGCALHPIQEAQIASRFPAARPSDSGDANVAPVPPADVPIPRPPPPQAVRPAETIETTGGSIRRIARTAVRKEAKADREPDSVEGDGESSGARALVAASEQIDALVKGSAAVSVPATVKQQDVFTVHLRVSPEGTGTLTAALKNDFPENETVIGKSDVRLTSTMQARVSGIGFEVDPKEPVDQLVSVSEPTDWSWQVTAKNAGRLSLDFELLGFVDTGGDKPKQRTFFSYRQPVDVEVSPKAFVTSNWQWLASTLVIPLALAAWGAFKKRREPGRPVVSD